MTTHTKGAEKYLPLFIVNKNIKLLFLVILKDNIY